MSHREVRTYGGGVLGVTPGSDVTQKAKAMTNAGTTAAAGLVPGVVCGCSAFAGQHDVSNAVVGESGLSRSERKLGDWAARQWPNRGCANGWCRAQVNPDERADGQYGRAVKAACRRPNSRSAVCDEWPAASGEDLGRDSLCSRPSDGGQSSCVLHTAGAACGFSGDWQHGLVARDKRNVVARRVRISQSTVNCFRLARNCAVKQFRNFDLCFEPGKSEHPNTSGSARIVVEIGRHSSIGVAYR